MKPSYILIKERIEEMILSGNYKPGDRLDSEYIMAERFGVSRETFRSAIKLLEQDGKVVVRHGVGTFVTNPIPEISSSLDKLTSITTMIQSAGLHEGERLESIRTEECSLEYAEIFNLKPGDPILIHERIRTANGENVVFSINVLPKAYIGNIFEEEGFSGSLFQFLEKKSKIKLVRTNTELVVPLHTDRYCQRLLIKPETTVLLLKQLHFDDINRPILYSLDYLRNDVFKFWIRRQRD